MGPTSTPSLVIAATSCAIAIVTWKQRVKIIRRGSHSLPAGGESSEACADFGSRHQPKFSLVRAESRRERRVALTLGSMLDVPSPDSASPLTLSSTRFQRGCKGNGAMTASRADLDVNSRPIRLRPCLNYKSKREGDGRDSTLLPCQIEAGSSRHSVLNIQTCITTFANQSNSESNVTHFSSISSRG